MKFISQDASLIWQAVSRVMKATDRKVMGSEINAICLETTEDGRLLVQRYSSNAYAEHFVDQVDILEPGKILVGDGTIFSSIRGRVSFEIDGMDLVGTELGTDNVTKLRLSQTDANLYERITTEIEGASLTVDLNKRILWTQKGEGQNWDWILFDGDKIITTNQRNITILINDFSLTDKFVFIQPSLLDAYLRHSKIAIDYPEHRVWVLEDNFRYCNTTMEKAYKDNFYWDTFSTFMSYPKTVASVNPEEFVRLIKDVFEISEDRVYRQGFCELKLEGSVLTIKSIGQDTGGEIKRTIQAEVLEGGDFVVKNYPKMMLDAISTIEKGEKIILEVFWNDNSKSYGLILHSDRVYNLIPCSI